MTKRDQLIAYLTGHGITEAKAEDVADGKAAVTLPTGEFIVFESDSQRDEFLALGSEGRARYGLARLQNTGHKLSLMLGSQKAPDGRVRGSDHPTRDWDRGRRSPKKAEE